MKNAFSEVAVYATKDESIRKLPNGAFTEGYSSVEEFSGHPKFRLVWEYLGTPANADRSWNRICFLNSNVCIREESQKEASSLEALWAFCLRIQGKGWKLSVTQGQRPCVLIPGSGNSGSGRDAGISRYIPDCSSQEAIEEINSWLECQDNVDRFVAVLEGRGRDF